MKRSPDDPRGPNLPSGEVQFGPPVVAPGVTDPQAVRYAQELAARRPPKPGRYTAPAGGPPTPPIPRLDMPAQQGSTMSDQAAMHQAYASGPPPGPSMFQGMPAPSQMPQAPGLSRPPAGILPADTLPIEAKDDPNFRPGGGSMYASAQPDLAYKYGVIRGGQRIAPQALGQPRAGLSPATVAGMKAVQEAQQQRQNVESEDARIQREAAASSAGSAGRFGNTPSDGPVADPAMTQDAIKAAARKLDDFDYNTFREVMMKDIINNEGQKNIIEARCIPLDITDLIMRGYVTQRVPIVPGKFEPEFRSMTGAEDLAIKRLVMEESKGMEVTERYLLDKFSLMAVTIGLSALNSNPLPTHEDAQGNFNEDAFWKKFNLVTKYPFHMLGSLGVNYFWFDMRVRKLFVAEKLGNG